MLVALYFDSVKKNRLIWIISSGILRQWSH